MNRLITFGCLVVIAAGCAHDQQGYSTIYGPADSNTGVLTSQGAVGTNPDLGGTATGTGDSLPKLYETPANQPPGSSNTSSRIYTEAGKLDQGFSEKDRFVTQTIRQAWSKYAPLAVASQSVKIIAHGDTVTLTGTVPNEDAKRELEALAKSSWGVVSVDNQLEVNPEP